MGSPFSLKDTFGFKVWGYSLSFLINGILMGSLFLGLWKTTTLINASFSSHVFPVHILLEEASQASSIMRKDVFFHSKNQKNNLSSGKKKQDLKKSFRNQKMRRDFSEVLSPVFKPLEATSKRLLSEQNKGEKTRAKPDFEVLLGTSDSFLKAPELLQGSPVSYPEEARRQGLEGDVTLLLTIDEKGNVHDVSVRKQSGWILLDNHAVAHAKTMSFHPALKDGEPIVVSVERTLSFRLEDEKNLSSLD
ncbi:MAG TPA: energy transducer TonB [Alphaproteobacteria bacterium]|nr:energy transducer TonB [Alphaproteobacteria bacterium]HQS94126.1 energy transducer TonB [Alphaproteobacteria bacterium]